MSELFWPGDDRAGDLFTDRAFLEAMVAVEAAWVGVSLDVPDVDLAAEPDGNAAVPLVAALRAARPDLDIHTGLTSQDVVDTALMVMLRAAVTAVRTNVSRCLQAIGRLVEDHGATAAIGRTLTQWALPVTFGHKLEAWHAGLSDADASLAELTFPAQIGGPVGTLHDGVVADRLGLVAVTSWHTRRRPITRAGDALVATTDACGHVARDVLELSRPEIGEVTEGRSGGSSSMPHKANPVLSVLIRRAALTTPQLGATLHLAAADQVDERADGAWHAEWDTLRILARRTAVATSQTASLLAELRVHPDRMNANLLAAERLR